MNEIASISGAIIVAIITLTGTYFINEFTKNLEYKNVYYIQIVNRRLDALEKLGECLNYFSVVERYNVATNQSFTYYPWLKNKETCNKVTNDLYGVGRKMVWMDSTLASDFCELFSEVSVIKELDYSKYDKDYKYTLMEKHTNNLREKSIKLEKEMYNSLQDGFNIKEFIKDNKSVFTIK